MKLNEIIEKLKKYEPEEIFCSDPDAYIETYKLFESTNERFSPYCLYIAKMSELPENIENLSCNLLCVSDQEISEKLRNLNKGNIYVLYNCLHKRNIVNCVADILQDEMEVVARTRRILDSLHQNAGLQRMVDVAEESFENPIAITDITMKILASSHKYQYQNPVFGEQHKSGYVKIDIIESMRADKVLQDSRRLKKVMWVKRKNCDEWLFRTVFVHDIAIAEIAVVAENRPFTNADVDVLERFGQFVAIELQKNEFFRGEKGLMWSYFLDAVLSNEIKSEEKLLKRAAMVGWKTYEHFIVFVIVDPNKNLSKQKLSKFGETIRDVIPDCHWTIKEMNLVVLVSRPDEKVLSEREISLLDEVLSGNNLTAGLSNPFSDLTETLRFYHQGLETANTAVFGNMHYGIFKYSDNLIYNLAKFISASGNIRDFCPPEIEKIYRYDKKNDSDLVKTLNVFLDCCGSYVEAAKKLNIHHNSMLYRMNRIKELTGLDMEDGYTRLVLQLWFKFAEYQNMREK